MSQSVDERVKMTLGDLVIQLAHLQKQNDDLREELAAAKLYIAGAQDTHVGK